MTHARGSGPDFLVVSDQTKILCTLFVIYKQAQQRGKLDIKSAIWQLFTYIKTFHFSLSSQPFYKQSKICPFALMSISWDYQF